MAEMSQTNTDTTLKPPEVPEIVNGLDYELEENPPWRAEGDGREVSAMLREVVEMKERYEREGLAESERTFCERFAHGMAVDHIYHTNVCESVGTQTYGDTQSAVDDFFAAKDKGESPSLSVKETNAMRETKNMCRALERMHKLHTEMECSGLLTVDQLLDVHREVLGGLHKNAGELRKRNVMTETLEEGKYFYVRHELVETRLYSVIEHHNIYMEALEKKVKDGHMTAVKKVLYVVKCAAWLLFNFVHAVHPFVDGNGRMCRLMTNYVLSLIAPFPISIYYAGHGKRDRDAYVQAIVRCRKNPREGPRQLATMLLEGVWEGWKSFYESFDSFNAKKAPSISIRKSKAAQHLEERVTRVVKSDRSVDVNEAIRVVQSAIEAVDTTQLEPTQSEYKCIDINGERIKTIIVAVFP